MLTDRDIAQLDLHALTDEQAAELCRRLRAQLLDTVCRTGGHLASNLGVVELTVALHRVFSFEKDRLVFDVGHQCYIHKMLTGRADAMPTIRQLGGLAGFPKPGESPCDAFIAGHASNSVSVALGMARARALLGRDERIVALIGDGALTGGLAMEGLSNAGQSGEKLLVVLNDNGMSITKNEGGLARYLARQRLKPQYLAFKRHYRKFMARTALGRRVYRLSHKLKTAIKGSILPSSMFEDMGFEYLGPVDGHDVRKLTAMLRYADELDGPVLLHVRTVKGKGWEHAEETPDRYHGISPFDLQTGQPMKRGGESFSSVFGRTLCRLAAEHPEICAVTAAMQSGTGLDEFARRFPDRFFDVGIAEGHAVSMAAGLAKQGAKPVFAVYSTFLQRGYDMLLHDVALLGLHVVFAVDRAGLVGEDGETHHGVFDVAYLDSVPGMTVLAPASFAELESMLEQAVLHMDGPVAIRFPRGGECDVPCFFRPEPSSVLRQGDGLTMVGYGVLVEQLMAAAELLERDGIRAQVVKLNRITPLDPEAVLTSVRQTGALLVAEDCVEAGSVGQRLCAELAKARIPAKIALCGGGRSFVPHGSVGQLQKQMGLDPESLYHRALEVLDHG